jgi:hypothetical protein
MGTSAPIPFATDATRRRPEPYAAQRLYVKTLLRVVAGLLEAVSETDEVVAAEVAGLPDGLVAEMSVFGMPDVGLRVQVHGRRLQALDWEGASDEAKPHLEIVFKHITNAFLVFSFQEGTAVAFAHGRMSVEGELAYAMRLVRCLDRCETIVLPRPIAKRAVKTVRELSLAEQLPLAVRTLGGLARGLVKGMR